MTRWSRGGGRPRAWRTLLAGGLLAIAGCAPLPLDDSTSDARSALPRIWDVREQRFIAVDELVRRVAPVRYRLLGEMHDDPLHHTLRAGLIARIAGTGIRPAILFEQFDLENEPALRAAQQAGTDAEGLARAGALDRTAWQWPLHRPLLEAALRAGWPVHAANASRTALGVVARTGDPGAIAQDVRNRIARAPWGDSREKLLEDDIRESHCNQLPAAAVPRLALAQRVRDAAMAEAVVGSATADGAVLIAGNGHVRRDLAVPLYLDAPAADIVSVGLVEVSPEEAVAPDFPRNVLVDQPGLDYAWLTARVARDDPCKGMQRR